jgi:alpha-1,3-mannosyltransferase
VCGTQVGLGWPFIAHDWRAYMNGAFDLGRVFTHTWTVNWKFIPEEQFISKELALVRPLVPCLVR